METILLEAELAEIEPVEAEPIAVQVEPVPERHTAGYAEMLQGTFRTVAFTPGELTEIGRMLHGLTIRESGQERRVLPETTYNIRKRIRHKLGVATLAGAMGALCREAFFFVPPLDDDMVPLMRRLAPVEEWELQLAAAGLTTKESAALRRVTYNTAHTQRTSLRSKRAASGMAGVILNDYRLKVYSFMNLDYVCPVSGAGVIRQADHAQRIDDAY